MKGGISLKIKLAVSKQRYKEVEDTLTQCGLEIDDDADFTLSENDARNGENPHEYRLFCPSILLLILD